MALPTVYMTELDAVNTMLASIGQTPVNTLAVSGIRDVAIAQLALQNVTREVLNRGWSFNTDKELTIALDGNGEIPVAATYLWLDSCRPDQDFTVKADASDSNILKLWDRENHTFDLSLNHNAPIKFDIIWAILFEEIPNVARNYIAIRAARIFQSQVLASDILFKFTSAQEQEAYADLLKLEARTKDRNWFRSAADTNQILQRTRAPSRWR